MAVSMNQYDSLKARIYDQYFTGVDGDKEFFVEEALLAKGAVLELGCGTGRITLALANANVRVVGLDLSPEMLAGARKKATGLDNAVRKRVRLLAGDMRTLDLNQRFKLIIVPYRTFMHLLTPQEQVATLLRIREHLIPGGQLILDLYDPSLDHLSHASLENVLQFDSEFVDEVSGHRMLVWYSSRHDVTSQILEQRFYFDEVDEGGSVIARYYSPLLLRYTHRYEMHYLLELCGYEIKQLYGDFYRGAYIGREQIWVATVSTN
jgi:SAM-dependent methyltransferase